MTTLLMIVLATAAPPSEGSRGAVIWPAKDIVWTDAAGVPGAQAAVLWGDPQKDASGTFKRFPRGTDIPFHKHTHDQHTLVMSGHLALRVGDQPAQEVGPGSYAFVPAGTPHGAICRRDADCVVYEEQPGPADFIRVDAVPVAPPAPVAAATRAPVAGTAPAAPLSRKALQERQSAAAAVPLLAQRVPEAEWSADTHAAADLDGDGADETVLVGRVGGDIWIGIVTGPLGDASRRWTMRFPVGEKRQDAVCDARVTLGPEALALPYEQLGCRASSTDDRCRDLRERSERLKVLATRNARGIALDDGRCNPFHIYWDTAEERFKWWRRQ